MKELLMGNEAIALGALAAGVGLVSGYPGTPSTEVLETVAKRNPGHIYVEWSVNEKVALEVAAGAAYSGVRSLVTMKQVGLNVASDPLMSLNYVGIKAGMIIFVADDPGPISSQTEQDTRHFGKYSKIPVFDPTSPEEAYAIVSDAFKYSEKYSTPVILRATTRICHSCSVVEVVDIACQKPAGSFEKDSRWVIFPKLSYTAKKRLEAREIELSQVFSEYDKNEIIGSGNIGIACGGISYAYVCEAISGYEKNFSILKIATPFPFPGELAEKFLANTDKVIVFEELDPVIEDALIYLCGKKGIKADIFGKRTGDVINAGELSSNEVARSLDALLQTELNTPVLDVSDAPKLPVRPPVLCAGCPHRASFYVVKKAMEGKKTVYCGDIGCYTLGNAAPLNMVDTCLCMGAGITIAQGIYHAGNDSINFAFVGDSTFFASGITGVINAVFNKANMVLIVLDNSTTAMTGHQTHPGIGKTVMGMETHTASIPDILKAIGLQTVIEADPLDFKSSVEAVKIAACAPGVSAVIFRSPCIVITKKTAYCDIDRDICIGCRKCIRELGCPAIEFVDHKAQIVTDLCTGCGLCSNVCPTRCIKREVL